MENLRKLIIIRWQACIILCVLMSGLGGCIDLKDNQPRQPPTPVPPHPRQTPLPHPIYGVTVDSIEAIDDIVDALGKFSRWPTTRVVFDPFLPPQHYANALTKIQDVSFVMGEILDSSVINFYSLDDYLFRVTDYVDTLANVVDVWEVGNEVNGAWLGDPTIVAAKVTQAFNLVRGRHLRTAMTLYYNEGCATYPWEDMFNWLDTQLSETVRLGLDYVWLSYYEDDCKGLQPDWPTVFERLAALFPTSWIGFGEVATAIEERKELYLRRYYTLAINHPAYVGGYFWWYFNVDMVPHSQPLWSVLNALFAAGPVAKIPPTTTP